MNYKLMKCGAEFLKKMAKARPELERIFEENNCSVEKSAKDIGIVVSGIHDELCEKYDVKDVDLVMLAFKETLANMTVNAN